MHLAPGRTKVPSAAGVWVTPCSHHLELWVPDLPRILMTTKHQKGDCPGTF